jgi:hypothetical protein
MGGTIGSHSSTYSWLGMRPVGAVRLAVTPDGGSESDAPKSPDFLSPQITFIQV